MAEGKYEKAECLALLREKRNALLTSGEDRYPKRSDFSEWEVAAIKAHLGPWPRALEAAGEMYPASPRYILMRHMPYLGNNAYQMSP